MDGLIHIVFIRGIRWKGNHEGPGTELDVTIAEAKELMFEGTIKEIKLPADPQPITAFKLPSTNSLRRMGL